jgi:hypothetical protein
MKRAFLYMNLDSPSYVVSSSEPSPMALALSRIRRQPGVGARPAKTQVRFAS